MPICGEMQAWNNFTVSSSSWPSSPARDAREGCHGVDRQNARDHPGGASRSEEAFSSARAFGMLRIISEIGPSVFGKQSVGVFGEVEERCVLRCAGGRFLLGEFPVTLLQAAHAGLRAAGVGAVEHITHGLFFASEHGPEAASKWLLKGPGRVGRGRGARTGCKGAAESPGSEGGATEVKPERRSKTRRPAGNPS